MLRDVFSGVSLAALIGAVYALGMHFGPLSWNLGDDTFDLLVLVGAMLSLTGFPAGFLDSRLNRRLREADSEIDERNRRAEKSIRARALRLNAYALARVDGMAETDAALVASEAANVVPFPDRREHLRRPAITHGQASV